MKPVTPPVAIQAIEPVDLHVGARLRLRRRAIGCSQEDLAEATGVTFQQIQKYERGTNRISASRLYQIAVRLGVTISFFFEGLDETGAPVDDGLFILSDMPELATVAGFPPAQRRMVKAMISAIAVSLREAEGGERAA